MIVLDSEGRELRRTDHDDDGQVVPGHVTVQASLVGAIRLLEEIAKRDDNPHYRRAARIQADGLKALLRKVRDGKVWTDAEILGPLLQEPRRALQREVLTIEMEKP